MRQRNKLLPCATPFSMASAGTRDHNPELACSLLKHETGEGNKRDGLLLATSRGLSVVFSATKTVQMSSFPLSMASRSSPTARAVTHNCWPSSRNEATLQQHPCPSSSPASSCISH
ncbi:uncharacterized protein Tco025E_01728 [Trypanosoma conorhini]|uniref:Uncharacterized protein n=1 Tax=Trypanosoma conorhini TaxID=83891 RepID=A0A422Q7S8_9TRYP|nr:uncharacterized protein Tco025E_01728 [Trypanosoma conorhini]RNF26023.1 hypothetical protein Tco025E_01728 [Trypanosoma conorhini]